jgi:hypothetical protein
MARIPYIHANGFFETEDLYNYIVSNKMKYIIVGAEQRSFAEHTKKYSLDCWLRLRSDKPDTKQAVSSIIENIVRTDKRFKEGISYDDETGRQVKSLIVA